MMRLALFFSVIMLSPLAGCTDRKEAVPAPTSHTTPTASGSTATSARDDHPLETKKLRDAKDFENASNDPLEDSEPTPSVDTIPESAAQNSTSPPPQPPSLPQAPSAEPTVSMTSTTTGASATITWPVPSDPDVMGYYLYYGRYPSSDSGICSYEERIAVTTPPITIAELEPNRPYFFAISTFQDFESLCSPEATVITPLATS